MGMGKLGKFLYTANDIAALEVSLSPERLQPYIVRAGGSRSKAILIYEKNTALSEALYGVAQATEVALRNSIHRVLSTHHGPMWFESVQLQDPQSEKINNARFEIDRNKRIVTPGGIIAELNLGFWTSLISARYEKGLWVPHLHKTFQNATRAKRNSDGSESIVKLSRAEIFDQLERIRTLRNRIAHHESILKFDLQKSYSETLEALSWVCPTSAEWVRSTNSFPERFHLKSLSYPAPKLAQDPPGPRPGLPVIRIAPR
jgi:Abi-like protein.